ncbi:MAG: hypothetical protein HUJ76_00255 [Parasporobacterium sp.]|nr:hypothetical protein [Parasporobacterium sp.]
MSLIDDIKSGSSDAIKQLYQENAQDIYDFAKGITGNHDTAMQATKSTLSKLIQQIQGGQEPASIHSEALKIAYDEACKIAMPSVENVKSPYDQEKPAATVQEKQPRKEPEQPRRREEYSDNYYEDDYDDVPQRRPQPRNRRDYDPRRQPQQPPRRSRNDYYEDDYDDRYYDDRYDDRYYDDDYDDYQEKKGHGAGFVICLIINIILVLLLIWFLIGLLANLSVIPAIDLGYSWFNGTVYPLF